MLQSLCSIARFFLREELTLQVLFHPGEEVEVLSAYGIIQVHDSDHCDETITPLKTALNRCST